MKNFITRKISRATITAVLVLLALIAIFRIWVYYTESPWTRDARFSADVVAIAPDVSGIIRQVAVHDNQQVEKNQVLFTIDQPRYEQTLAQAQAEVAYYQAVVDEKQREARRRNQLGVAAMPREQIELANNQLQISRNQLAKAQAACNLAKIDLQRTVVRAPAAGWVTNLNIYDGEFITRGSSAVTLIKQGSFYLQAYLEETKLYHVHVGDHAEIVPLGSNQVLYGTVASIAAGVTNASSNSRDDKGMATVDSNLEWVRLAQRIPVRIHLDQQPKPGNLYPAGTTATVVIIDAKKLHQPHSGWLYSLFRRLRELG